MCASLKKRNSPYFFTKEGAKFMAIKRRNILGLRGETDLSHIKTSLLRGVTLVVVMLWEDSSG